jgi:hypothetical protein
VWRRWWIIFITTVSGEKLNYQLNAQGGFTAAAGSPDAITSEQVIYHHRSAQGWYGGTGTVPSFIVPVLYISYVDERNYHENPRLFIMFA